jgi:hypothetical protein
MRLTRSSKLKMTSTPADPLAMISHPLRDKAQSVRVASLLKMIASSNPLSDIATIIPSSKDNEN